jgi:hypothetical protein
MEFKPVTRHARLNLFRTHLFSHPLEVPHRLRAIVSARESSVVVQRELIGET